MDRAGANAPSVGDVLEVASSLRWSRPDLTAALAEHLVETAIAAGNREMWVAASAWVLHGRSTSGDGRIRAAEVLGALPEWGGRVALSGSAGARLRIELAAAAHVAQAVDVARSLLTAAVAQDDADPAVRADALCGLARCALEDAPDEAAGLLDDAAAAWARHGGPNGAIGEVGVELLRATADRRAGRASDAARRAADGLARLHAVRGPAHLATASGHLAAALAAEWISGLLDSGRPAAARDACGQLTHLLEPGLRTRQHIRLRLAVMRATAVGDRATDAFDELRRAAEDAGAADVPDLESICRSTLGELYEQRGRPDEAFASLRLGIEAGHRDRSRSEQLRERFATTRPLWAERSRTTAARANDVMSGGRHGTGHGPGGGRNGHAVPGLVHTSADRRTDATTEAAAEEPSWAAQWLEAHSAEGRPHTAARPRRSARRTDTPRTEVPATRRRARRKPAEETSRVPETSADGKVPTRGALSRWPNDPPGDSPIGDILLQELRGGAVSRHESRYESRTDARETRSERASERWEPAEMWTTGDWPGSTGTDRGHSRFGVHRDPSRSGRSSPRREPSASPSPSTANPGTRPSDDPDAWLAAALADLDRIWPRTGVRQRAEQDRTATHIGGAGGERRREPSDSGPVAVIDLVAAGKRMSGRRATHVMRAVSDRLTTELPFDGRLHAGEPDAVSVVLPGRTPASVAEWLHRVLPELAGAVSAEDCPPGVQLRASVHGSDGTPGAQILQRLDRPERQDDTASDALGAHRPEPRSRTGARFRIEDVVQGSGGRRRRRETEDPPGERSDTPSVSAGTRHAVADRSPEPSLRGGGHAASENPNGADVNGDPTAGQPPEEMGIADLLAGALAAYRGI